MWSTVCTVEPSPVTPAELRAARAESIHETALEYAMKEQYNMAAAYFRYTTYILRVIFILGANRQFVAT